MSKTLLLSAPALADLLAINDYYLVEVNEKTAAKLVDRLEAGVNSLCEHSERGSVPRELLSIGMHQYQQLIIKPYRLIYESLPEQVIVHAILDGRRDIQTLLIQRLLTVNV